MDDATAAILGGIAGGFVGAAGSGWIQYIVSVGERRRDARWRIHTELLPQLHVTYVNEADESDASWMISKIAGDRQHRESITTQLIARVGNGGDRTTRTLARAVHEAFLVFDDTYAIPEVLMYSASVEALNAHLERKAH